MQRVLKFFFASLTGTKSNSPDLGYTLLGRLDGHLGPINCLSFTRDGSLLASGGDDEAVRIWDIETLVSLQVIRDPAGNWGQVTCVNWLSGNSSELEGNTLCFGTGRGLVIVEMKEASITRAFRSGDGVEAMAFDPSLKRLLVSSHYGTVRMYTFEENDQVVVAWESSIQGEVPRSLLIMENGLDVIVFGLEKGSMVCRDSQTGAEKWVRSLKSGIGNAMYCPKHRYILIDNLVEGFDIYVLNRPAPIRKFYVPPQRRGLYTRGVAFGEGSNTMMCGSDHGSVYIYDIKSSTQLQTLMHEEGRLVQAIGSISITRKHLIASAVSEGRYDICIWVKPDGKSKQRSSRNRLSPASIINIILLTILIFTMFDFWLKMIKAGSLSVATSLQKRIAHWTMSTQTHAVPAVPVAADEPGLALGDIEPDMLVQLLMTLKMNHLPGFTMEPDSYQQRTDTMPHGDHQNSAPLAQAVKKNMLHNGEAESLLQVLRQLRDPAFIASKEPTGLGQHIPDKHDDDARQSSPPAQETWHSPLRKDLRRAADKDTLLQVFRQAQMDINTKANKEEGSQQSADVGSIVKNSDHTNSLEESVFASTVFQNY
ncbi:WD40-repeat-containing domain protein [Amanita muscaria]